ncbi:MAG: type 4a pilus biogenesis protein PilO [Thiohalocapsa sp.]|jgi:type IV pilus assembly protein PilO|nr:type 4a pilus biogenesis protein PilO [Thiohalocapsa sp.]MCF7988903.1 type 4a pilus biogenesis protein PilO [Thiohalocapsa sp.]
MALSDLNDLDLNNPGDWPPLAKALGIGFLCVLIAGGWYYFVTSKQLDRLQRVESAESKLRASFEQKQHKAANLERYEEQLEEMRESFGAMLKQLPDKSEVASLLVDVSQTGLASGLEFELFQPSAEVNKDFYAELPIKLRVKGRYHEFGTFISGLAALPRIVTIHDVKISSPARGMERTEEPMALDATVKTYRYLEEPEVQ